MPARRIFDFRLISDQAAAVIGKPVAFYRNMTRAGGFGEPVAFVLVTTLVSAALFSLAYVLGLEPLPPGVVPDDGALVVAALIAVPLAALLSSVLASTLLYLLWRLMGSRAPFETAYRCFAFTYAITPITTVSGIVPYLSFAGIVWTLGLLAVASVEVHRISPRVAYPVFGALGIALVALTLSAAPWLSVQRALLEQSRARIAAPAKAPNAPGTPGAPAAPSAGRSPAPASPGPVPAHPAAVAPGSSKTL